METHRYLVDFDTQTLETEQRDVVIIGGGLAGMFTALEIAPHHDVLILAKTGFDTSNSRLAQGGIATSITSDDSPELHFQDTLYAGAGRCREEAVRNLVEKAKPIIKTLCEMGVAFDKTESGEFSVGREGAHCKNRILHAGDKTGAEVCDKLFNVVKGHSNITLQDNTFVVDLLTEDETCKGVLVYDTETQTLKAIFADIVVCATGGYGQLYANTSNPDTATGDGLAAAYRAGAELVDLEFVQFHPTVLVHLNQKGFLISEAVRGEGAHLLNLNRKRFMSDYHELGELAPRDVVSRALVAEMKKTHTSHVWVDATMKGREYLAKRFPTIFSTLCRLGIDPSKELIPVAPAAHYCMGGIKTDAYGRTNITGLYACGEAACTGVHGANRLASNSMLECLVFGQTVGNTINQHLQLDKPKAQPNIQYRSQRKCSLDHGLKADIQALMTKKVGMLRNQEGLQAAEEQLKKTLATLQTGINRNRVDFELQNIAMLSLLTTESALQREESRGAHFREDYPNPEEAFKAVTISQKREVCYAQSL